MVVASLQEAPSKRFPKRTFTRLRRHASFAKGSCVLADGSRAEMILCAECKDVDISPHVEKVGQQYVTAFEREFQANRRPQEAIDAMKARERVKMRPLTRAQIEAQRPPVERAPDLKPLPEEANLGR
jgi:hypothetical protein